MKLKQVVIIGGIIAFALINFCKWIYNELRNKEGAYSTPCHTPGAAKLFSTYVCQAYFQPTAFDYKGQRIEIGEAWVEKKSCPRHFLVWIPYREIKTGYELCFKLKEGEKTLRKNNAFFVIGDRGRSFEERSFSKNIPSLFVESLGESNTPEDYQSEVIPSSIDISLIDNWKHPRPKNIKVTFGRHQ